MNNSKDIMITGCCGFIGFHLCLRLLSQGYSVLGIDNMNEFYSVELKHSRLHMLQSFENFECKCIAIEDRDAIENIFQIYHFRSVIHLAGQASVQYSITNPWAYVDSNLHGFVNVLEACRQTKVEHFMYASSSSVYGANTDLPFSIKQTVDQPISFYAATKKANELFAHSYSHLYNLPTTGLRFFTVYGPWGRPDMAYFLFTDAIFAGKPIKVFNYGKMKRDFTYIDDAVEAVTRLLHKPFDHVGNAPPYRIYNIGNDRADELIHLIQLLERNIGKKALLELLPLREGDVIETRADIRELRKDIEFHPQTSLQEGLARFVEWYKEYYKK